MNKIIKRNLKRRSIKKLNQQIRALEEKHQQQLIAISVLCTQNTQQTVLHRIKRDNPFWTMAYMDVCNTVDREIDNRVRYQKLEKVLAEIKGVKSEDINTFSDLLSV